MLKPFGMIFFVVVMVWFGAIFVTSNPSSRIERTCIPISLMDRVVVATVQLLHEPWAADAHIYMKNFEYGCQFTIWKTFYEDMKGVRPGSSDVAPVANQKERVLKPAQAASQPALVEKKQNTQSNSVKADAPVAASAAPAVENEPKPKAPASYFEGLK